MAALTVWKFPTPAGADQALGTLEKLEDQSLIQVHDAAVVTWQPGQSKPKTHELHSRAKIGALGGGFWGLLFGLIFFVPLLGLAIGAAAGALFGSMADAGISESFVREVREKVTPGTSALFLLSSDAVFDKVQAEFSGGQAELIQTNLTQDQDARLRAAFGNEA